MKRGVGQFVCLVLGVLLLSLGAGILGGRLAVERHHRAVSARPAEAPNDPGDAVTANSPPATGLDEAPWNEVAQPAAMAAGATAEPATPSEPGFSSAVVPAEEATPPADIPPPASEDIPHEFPMKYVIQAMATSSRADAGASTRKIMAQGFPAVVSEADLPGKGKWYRVYVGPYETEDKARHALEGVRGISGYEDSFLKELKRAN